jgi:hypothetical protein
VKVFAIGLAFLIGFLYSQNVPKDVSAEDIKVIKSFEKEITPYRGEDFLKQIEFIKRVQSTILSKINTKIGIKPENTREIKDLIKLKVGQCHDVSRGIEQTLQYYGYEIRHLYIYFDIKKMGRLIALISPGTPSHAITEVKTSKGWVVIGSLEPWVSVDKNNNIVPADMIPDAISRGLFLKNPREKIYENFHSVRGLYSRHGKFFPPYTPIPDINWNDFINYNF